MSVTFLFTKSRKKKELRRVKEDKQFKNLHISTSRQALNINFEHILIITYAIKWIVIQFERYNFCLMNL